MSSPAASSSAGLASSQDDHSSVSAKTNIPATLYWATRRLSLEDETRLLKLPSHATKAMAVMRWNQAFWYVLRQTWSDLRVKLDGNGEGTLSMPRLHSIKEHVAVLNIFRSNAFNLGSTSRFQQAIFARISRINHSCTPNAQGNFHEVLSKFNVHAIRDVNAELSA